MGGDAKLESFAETLAGLTESLGLPGYVGDLARLEWMLHQKEKSALDSNRAVQTIMVNPTLSLVSVGWRNLPALIRSDAAPVAPLNEPAHVMAWRHPKTEKLLLREAVDADLLALKLIVEQIDLKAAAMLGRVALGDIQAAIDRAIANGLLLCPPSRIRRVLPALEKLDPSFAPYLAAEIFTLQWHITQACDLHCKHCYDRSDRESLGLDRALSILDDLYDFCRRMQVRGQVTFTGGNPMLYPHFEKVYQAAAQCGFGVAILGNPMPVARIERLLPIARPLFYQISLEGLGAHNDDIRGRGHFNRSLAFLQELRGLGIFSMVMLTLTRENLDQVLPLAELLKDRADHFTFNRLSTVGEGARLQMPEKNAFESFLRAYEAAAAANPKMGLKENLINIVRRERGVAVSGGCAGYGCGAAFNFLALLPDGEVHACRKFPSPLGHVADQSLYDIYHSALGERYRAGSAACRTCRLNPVCRGCPAIVHSLGLNICADKDPFCFV